MGTGSYQYTERRKSSCNRKNLVAGGEKRYGRILERI